MVPNRLHCNKVQRWYSYGLVEEVRPVVPPNATRGSRKFNGEFLGWSGSELRPEWLTRTRNRGQNEMNTAWEREARICVSYAVSNRTVRWDTAAAGPVPFQRIDADSQASQMASPTRCWKWCWVPKCLSTRCQVPEEDTYGLVAGGWADGKNIACGRLHEMRFKMGWIRLGSGRSAPVFYAVDHSGHAGSVSVRFGTKHIGYAHFFFLVSILQLSLD
ncbi:hypothetical protein B0H14DRAFT_2622636 [Mycena olivaceomarginata]|nr:hypothetical protein B0H14DRAFT_2622636 [Mycena olivaceomarginata]